MIARNRDLIHKGFLQIKLPELMQHSKMGGYGQSSDDVSKGFEHTCLILV